MDRTDVSGVLIWGAGSQGRLLAEMLKDQNAESPPHIFMFDPTTLNSEPTGDEERAGMKALRDQLPKLSHHVVAIGAHHGRARLEIGSLLEGIGLTPLCITAHNCHVSHSVALGKGIVIMPGATINHFSNIGDYCIVNTNASIDHECQLGEGVHIMGSAALAGRVCVESCASVGTNATVLPDLQIGSDAMVGAGAVVTKSVAAHTVVAGVPAKQIGITEPAITFPTVDWFNQLQQWYN